VDPRLVKSIMAAESAFNPNARSDKNAQGLMQLINDTAAGSASGILSIPPRT